MSMMDEWTKIESEADCVRVKADLEYNLESLKQLRERLKSILELTEDQSKTVISPLESMIERALISIERWNSRSVGSLYQVQNKVFSITFWNKDEAEDFVSKQCSTTNLHGLQINPLEVFGDKEKWIRENARDPAEFPTHYEAEAWQHQKEIRALELDLPLKEMQND